jgi:hypothetical protein
LVTRLIDLFNAILEMGKTVVLSILCWSVSEMRFDSKTSMAVWFQPVIFSGSSSRKQTA